jgi:hypothetical protein
MMLDHVTHCIPVKLETSEFDRPQYNRSVWRIGSDQFSIDLRTGDAFNPDRWNLQKWTSVGRSPIVTLKLGLPSPTPEEEHSALELAQNFADVCVHMPKPRSP